MQLSRNRDKEISRMDEKAIYAREIEVGEEKGIIQYTGLLKEEIETLK